LSEKSASNGRRYILLAGRIVLGAIFLVAAYAKMHPQAGAPWSFGSIKTSLLMFAMQVDSYQLLSSSAAAFVAQTLPFFELFLGIWLLSGLFARGSTLLTSVLLAGFFAVMVRTYALGLEINCGCFGPGEHLGAKTLIRDGSLLALSIVMTILAFVSSRRDRSLTEPQPILETR
jgi:uncharacterized membrane protein YphA (DoxX/SURF4 family)